MRKLTVGKVNKLEAVIVAFIVLIALAVVIGLIVAPMREVTEYSRMDDYLLELEDKWVRDSETTAHFDIPEDAPLSLLVKYVTDYKKTELYLDGELLLATEENDLVSCFYTYWIEFDHTRTGEKLRIVTENAADLDDIIGGNTYLGSTNSVIRRFCMDSLFPVVFSFLAIAAGIVIFVANTVLQIGKRIKTKVHMNYVAIFVFVSGFWILTDCQFLTLFMEGSERLNLLNYISTNCIAPVLMVIVRDMYDDEHKILDILRAVMMGITLVDLFGWLVFDMPIFTLLTMMHISIGAAAGICTFYGFREWKKYHSKHVALLLVGIFGLVIGGGSSILAYYLNGTGSYCIIYTGTLLFFTIVLVLTAVLRVVNHVRKLEISEKHSMEEARKNAEIASEAKTSFLLSISHDIRTPMNAIIGYTNIAKKHLDDKKYTEECLDNIHGAGDVLLGIINDVLDMSRIESGKLEINEAPMDICEFAKNMAAVISDSALKKSLQVTTDFGKVENKLVFADKIHLESVFLNILSNAVKYTEEGGSIYFGLRESDSVQPGFSRYTFTVTDDGVGMTKEFLEKIYEPFARAKDNKASGTGLGMSITKKIIDRMNGTILITSIPGNGTSVKVDFVFKKTDKVLSPERILIDYEELKGKRILIADDNRQSRDIIRSMLETAGLLAEEIDDGSFAVEMVREHEPGYYAAVLMDIKMPYMDGYKATTLIRSFGNKEKAMTPIIAMTANAFDADRHQTEEAGMDDHLAKPIGERELLDAIAKAIRARQK